MHGSGQRTVYKALSVIRKQHGLGALIGTCGSRATYYTDRKMNRKTGRKTDRHTEYPVEPKKNESSLFS